MSEIKYQPLYLKHRPQSLGELVGQKSVVKTLTNAIENDRIAHAYLFTGPRGTGKTSSARILAKSINCDKGPTIAPCLVCPSCESIRDSSCPSVFEIDAASNNSVDDARTLIERAPLAVPGGKRKLYIIDECHMLTKEAFNALLKTIEEPPPGVIFVLATTEEHKVPPTILSRCQRLMFRLANSKDLVEHLAAVAQKENIEIKQDALELVARRSGGGLRDALGLLDQASLLARPGEPVTQTDLLVLLGALDEDVLLSLSRGIIERNGKGVIDDISGLIMQGREPSLIAQELAKHFLNLTKASYVGAGQQGSQADLGQFILGSQAYIQGLIEQAKCFERAELTQMVEQLDGLEQALKRTSQPSMTLEMTLLSLCHRNEIANVKDLEKRLIQLERAIAEGDFSGHGAGSRTAAREDSHRPQPAYQPVAKHPVPQPAAPQAVPPPPAQAQTPPVRTETAAPQTTTPQAAAPAEPAAGAPPQENLDEQIEQSGRSQSDPYDDEDRLPMFAEDGSDEENDAMVDSPVSQIPTQQQSSMPAPVPAEHLAAAPAESQSAGLTELDEIWSELLDALHKRSIPAYSLVQAHAFPIRLEPGTLTIGVKQVFQKSIEGKVNQISTAYKDIRGEEIRVMVKIAEGGQPAAERPKRNNAGQMNGGAGQVESAGITATAVQTAPMESGTSRQSYGAPPPSVDDEDDGSDDEEPQPGGSRDTSGAANQKIESPGSAPSPVQAESATATKLQSQPKTRIESVILVEEGDVDSSLIQQAYKIFEGPGSRLIG